MKETRENDGGYQFNLELDLMVPLLFMMPKLFMVPPLSAVIVTPSSMVSVTPELTTQVSPEEMVWFVVTVQVFGDVPHAPDIDSQESWSPIVTEVACAS